MAALRLRHGNRGTLDDPATNDLESNDGELGKGLEQEGPARRGQVAIQRISRMQQPERLAVRADQRCEQQRARLPGTRRERCASRERGGNHVGQIVHRMSWWDPADRTNGHRRVLQRLEA